MTLGILTGLAREIDCLPSNDTNIKISCSGANPDRAELLTRNLVEQGCDALLSFGVAGALSPELSVGDIVVARGVIDEDGQRLESAETWKTNVFDGLTTMNGAVKEGWIYGSDTEIGTARMKSELFQRSRALCVDMETHRMAQVAAISSTPFLAIRAISDDSERALPSVALGVIGANGKPIITRIIKGLLSNPQQIPQLIALSKNLDTALAELRRVSRLIGPLFRFT